MIFAPPDNAHFITAACVRGNLHTPLGGVFILELLTRDHEEVIKEASALLVDIDAAFTVAQQTINDNDIYECGRQWALFAPGTHGHLKKLLEQRTRSWTEMAEVCQLVGFFMTRKTSFELNGVPVPSVQSPIASY